MRVVGGRLKGRALIGPMSDAIRPTSDRMREALFNILAHAHDDACDGARVLDLFAGTGAMAIEALSRGASSAVVVDDGAEARSLIRQNVEAMGLAASVRVFRRDATKLGNVSPHEPFDLVFCDPPYKRDLGVKALASALAGGWIAPDALVLLEEAADLPIVLPEGLTVIDRRVYGVGQVLFAERTGSAPAE